MPESPPHPEQPTGQPGDSGEPAGTAEGLLRAIGERVTDAATREALAELGQRARSVVDELSRQARSREAETASRPDGGDTDRATTPSGAGEAAADWSEAAAGPAGRPEPAAAMAQAGLIAARLEELRACLGEITDVLEGTVERLETVEVQLGDPDSSVEQLLAGGIERCERLLMGIEHRVLRAVAAGRSGAGRAGQRAVAMEVLVCGPSSDERARTCVDLEKQGLRSRAAADVAQAERVFASRRMPVAVLLAGAGQPGPFEEWKARQDRGTLPPAVVLADGHGPSLRDLPAVRRGDGAAALAALLTKTAAEQAEPGAAGADQAGQPVEGEHRSHEPTES